MKAGGMTTIRCGRLLVNTAPYCMQWEQEQDYHQLREDDGEHCTILHALKTGGRTTTRRERMMVNTAQFCMQR
jgi:hypothetical protein